MTVLDRMGDFIEDHAGKLIFAVMVVFMGFLLWLIVSLGAADNAERARLMAQCLADNKKEYECVSLLRNPAPQVMPIPIIIPMR